MSADNKYIAQPENSGEQQIDIERLRGQNREQNRRTTEFLNLPPDTHFDRFVMPFCGAGDALEVYLPYLGKESEAIFIDVAPEKVSTATQFARKIGFKGRVTGMTMPAADAFEELRSAGKKTDAVDIKLGLIWDKNWQKLLQNLSTLLTPGGLAFIQDMNPGTMKLNPSIREFEKLRGLILKIREKAGFENQIIDKIQEVAQDAGLSLVKSNKYQIVTRDGHPNHRDVLKFFDGASANLVGAGLITREEYDSLREEYSKTLDLETTEMSYPLMGQFILRK